MKSNTADMAQDLFDSGIDEKKLLAILLTLYQRFHEVEREGKPDIPVVILLPDGEESLSCAAIAPVEEGIAMILTGACAIAEGNGIPLATLQKQLTGLYGETPGVMARLADHAAGPRRPSATRGRGKRRGR